jgi:hypothetical protein
MKCFQVTALKRRFPGSAFFDVEQGAAKHNDAALLWTDAQWPMSRAVVPDDSDKTRCQSVLLQSGA